MAIPSLPAAPSAPNNRNAYELWLLGKIDKIQPILHRILKSFCHDRGMFGFGKKTSCKGKKSKALQAEGGQQVCAKQARSQQLRAEAMANARAARETLGDETVQKIAEIIARKENNPFEQALRKIEQADSDRVADEILYMLDEK